MSDYTKIIIVGLLIFIFFIGLISNAAKKQYDRDQQFIANCEDVGGYPKILSGKGIHERICLSKDMVIDLE